MAYFTGTPGKDTFVGSSANDDFTFNASNLSAIDTVSGGGGDDILHITPNADPTTIIAAQLHGVSGIRTIALDMTVRTVMTLDDTILAANPGLTIVSGKDVAIDASATTIGVTYSPYLFGGEGLGLQGTTNITAGSGDDRVNTYPELLTASDDIQGGAGFDQLHIYHGQPGFTADLGGVSGFEQVWLHGDAYGGPSVKVTDKALDDNAPLLSIFGSDSNDMVDASSVANTAHGINVSAGAGNDVLKGGAGRDYFYFDGNQLDSGDVVMGNGGEDTLFIRAPGTITAGDLAHVSGIEDVRLLEGGTSFALNDLSASKNAPVLAIYGSDGDDVIDASAVTLAWRAINVAAGAGDDVLKGGAGTDSFHFDIANLDAGDTVAGGSGYDGLYLTGSGTLDAAALSHVSGIEHITLLGGAASLVLGDGLIDASEPTLSVTGGAGDDTIDASALTHALSATGGGGDDTIIAGSGGSTIFGGDGADAIVTGAGVDVIGWTAPGTDGTFDTIDGFAPGTDRLQFGAAAFAVNGTAFDTVVDGGFGANLASADLLRSTTAVGGADDLLADLRGGNGTAGQGLFVLAENGATDHLMLYYADDASGHGHAYAIADLGATLTPGSLGLADFLFV